MSIVAKERAEPVKLEERGISKRLVDEGNRTVYTSEKAIYSKVLSPDHFKVLLYFGDLHWEVINLVTRGRHTLPAKAEAWSWMPDNTTLIGWFGVQVAPGVEQVGSTELYVYDPLQRELRHISLPEELQKTVLKVLDISVEGSLLVFAERVQPEREHLGLVVLRLK